MESVTVKLTESLQALCFDWRIWLLFVALSTLFWKKHKYVTNIAPISVQYVRVIER